MKRMKKWLALLMTAAMALSFAAAEQPEQTVTPETSSPGLFDLYTESDGVPVWLGTAVSPYEGLLVTAASLLPENLRRLMISDGGNVWEARSAVSDAAGNLVVILYETDPENPASGIAEMDTGASVTGDMIVLAGDENRSRICRSVYDAVPVKWRSASAQILSLNGSAAPGSVLMTKSGKVAGIAVAEWAEGDNRTVFLTAEAVNWSIAEALDAYLGRQGDPPEGLVITADANTVTFDWSAMTLPEKAEGEELYLVVADTGNRYLTYYHIENDTRCTMLLTPGRTYHTGVAVSAGAPTMVPVQYAVTELPPAEKLTDYGFVSRVCAIAEAPEGGLPDGTQPKPVVKVTEELLRSDRAYFLSSTTYEVTQTLDGISLLISLTDPEGNNYRYESGWIYDPSYMQDDTWSMPMSQTGLLQMLNESGYPAGTYEVAMYIGGALADSFTFELK